MNKSAVLFMFISLVAGGTHYLYQLLAARFLSFEDFGEFSGWLAWVYMGLAFAAFAQYVANFFPVRKKGLYISMATAGAVSIVALLLFVIFPQLNTVGIGLLALLVAPFTHWLLGQAQRRLLLMSFAIGGLVIGLAKIVLVVIGITYNLVHVFYWAVPLCYLIGGVFVLPVLWKSRDQALSGLAQLATEWKSRLWGAFVLSFLTVYIPNVDLLYVDTTQTAEDLSQFAQASLFYKVVFFIILIFSQWILPKQLETGAKQKASPRPMKNFVRICVLGLMFSLCASAVARDLYLLVLDRQFQAPQLWVFLSCFNMAMFTGLFIEIQSQIAALKVKDATIALIIQMSGVLISWILHLDLVQYLQIQVLVNGMLLFLLTLGAGRIFARQVTD